MGLKGEAANSHWKGQGGKFYKILQTFINNLIKTKNKTIKNYEYYHFHP